jgi:site-specific DNA-methyltransferase (adenine-specific)
MRSVWSISTTPKSEKSFGSHPTQKPLELMMRLIAMCSVEGDTVLDPFCGSGTTGVASVSMGRNFVGIDLDETYLEIAKRRIEEKLEVN